MDSNRFDHLARQFGMPLERRAALASLAASAIALLLPETGDAKRKRNTRARRQNARRHDGRVQDEARHRKKKGRKKKQDPPRGSTPPPRTPDPSTSTPSETPTRCFDNTSCTISNGRNLGSCNFGASEAFREATCNGCNLDNANLRGADLRQANLSGTNLHDTCLVEANLTGAIVEGSLLREAVLCRTTMPDGSISNSGCDAPTACCATCIPHGGSCGGTLGGECCGGGACQGGVCTCIAPTPVLCDDVCRECCDGADCGSSICCQHVCCEAGALCLDGECCLPLTEAEACIDMCGTVNAGCGVIVECPACPAVTCHDSRCASNTCEYLSQPNLTECAAGASTGVCCDASCAAGNCCDSSDCTNPTPICQEHVCSPCASHNQCPTGNLCCNGSCRAVECCGSDVSTCGDAETCYVGTCSEGTCQYATTPDNQSAPGCDSTGAFCCAGDCCANGQRCYDQHCCTPVGACPAGFCGAVDTGCGETLTCQCGAGLDCCNEQCVDLENDPNNCGNCGLRCPTGDICINGACVATCGQDICVPGSNTPDCCDESCTDLRHDHDNCGSCGNVCTGAGQVCTAGNCGCACEGVACLITRWGGTGTAPGKFQRPIAMAIAPDLRVFVADAVANTIEIFSPDGQHLARWTGFSSPGGIAFGSGNTIYISESGQNRVGRYQMDGTLIRHWGTNGSGNSQFRTPNGLAVAPNGDVYVADKSNNRVQRFKANGDFLNIIGASELSGPSDVAVDPDGRVFATDDASNLIRIYSAAGALLDTWGTPGGGLGQLRDPFEIEVTPNGYVYVLEGGNSRVQVFSLAGVALATWKHTQSGDPDLNLTDGGSLAVAPDGTVYVVEGATDRVLVYCVTPDR